MELQQYSPGFLRGGGRVGVAYFFVLSGFLTGLKAANNEKYEIDTTSATGKAINFYLYHIPFLILILPKQIWMFKENLVEGLTSFSMNALLLHSWVPISSHYYFGFNGPSWFLSTLLMLVIVTPFILKFVRKTYKKNANSAKVIILCCFLMQIFLACVAEEETSRYWLYVFPPIRMLDYLSGICLGFIFHNRTLLKVSETKYSIYEIIAVCIYIVYLVEIPYIPKNFTWSAILMPGALFTIYVLARGIGIISKILSYKAVIYIGNNSFYYMMCHQVVFSWMNSLNKHFLNLNPWMAVVVSLILILLGKRIFDFYMSVVDKYAPASLTCRKSKH